MLRFEGVDESANVLITECGMREGEIEEEERKR
jgi:hypothetical protein